MQTVTAPFRRAAALALALAAASPALALVEGPVQAQAQAYLVLPLSELAFEGDPPAELDELLVGTRMGRRPHPTVRLDGGLEAWLGLPFVELFQDNDDLRLRDARLAVVLDGQAAGATRLEGELWLPAEGGDEAGQRLRFSVDATSASPEGRLAYLEARYLACRWRLAREVPGGPLWRRLADTAREELSAHGPVPVFDPNGRLSTRWGRRRQGSDVYGLFSGGRALAENLRLDEVLEPANHEHKWLPLSELEGVTTPAIDWGEELERAKPVVDAAARVIPEDQPMLQVRSLGDLRRLLEELRGEAPQLLEFFEQSAEDGALLARYEAQLGVELSQALERLSQLTVRSIALTGSDTFVRTGTDVAFLFETDGTNLLPAFLRGAHVGALESREDAWEESGVRHGVSWSGVRSRWRELSSYMAELEGGLVLLSNSAAQLERLIDVAKGHGPALAELPEYKVYRDRYPAAPGEAFLLISDPTIRRWVGPEWRIGAARRTRAAAVLADEAAAALLRAAGEAGPRALRVRDDLRVPGGGGLTARPRGAASELYGSPEFLTPVIELDIERVTEAEAAAYRDFRTSYERQWRDDFDPVVGCVRLLDDGLEVDLSIRPLARRSDYRELIRIVGDGQLQPGAGVNGTQVAGQMVWALDTRSRSFMELGSMAKGMVPGVNDPLGWVGDHLTVYLNDGDFWERAGEAADPLEYVEENGFDLPLGVRVACKSPLQLAGFLAGLRAYINETAPNLVRWEPREYGAEGQHRYMALVPTQDLGMRGLDLYYATQPDALWLAFTPEVIEQMFDDLDAKAGGESQGQTPAEDLGRHALAQVSGRGLELLGHLWLLENRDQLQLAAWDGLHLWDELRRRFPGEDPQAVWRRYFPSVPKLAAGDSLVWNRELGAYESQAFGTPMTPRLELAAPSLFRTLAGLSGGLTFEEGDGLRAQVRLQR